MIPGFVGHVQYEDGSTAFHGPLQVGEIPDAVTTQPGASPHPLGSQPSPLTKAIVWGALVVSTLGVGYFLLRTIEKETPVDE